ncbi:hypothetical protein [Gordonia sp. 852002-51296_SCH5728562-b]|uniref:hypothetical protein n=1 Tax=Gordonia sp. 852002-51296_SCH5728562-b TaxID=1834101 RepID=UPI0007EB95C5|nr:hypothetical protein [Gordonia sp. 852002-51296_SCH5728562-b]OBA39002.1 hypothetical protein A5766_04410 [Gordonia sp. 852002-51296_SCH5728562-b]
MSYPDGRSYGPGNAGMELIRILAVLMACGAVVMGGYAFAQAGWLDEAGSAITVFFATYVRLMAGNRLLLPSDAEDADFKRIRGAFGDAVDDYEEFLAKRKGLALAMIALGYAVVFLVFRQLMITALAVFNNVWVLGMIGLGVAAILTMPRLVVTTRDLLKHMSDDVTPQAAQPVQTVQFVQVQPFQVPVPPQPSAPVEAPVSQSAPVPAPRPDPAPARRTRRPVTEIKKAEGDHA